MDKTTLQVEKNNKIEPGYEEHSIWASIILHLLPGILGGLVYFLAAPYVKDHGYPTVSALILAGALVITPIEMGILFYLSRKNNQRLFDDFLAYQQPLPLWQYIIWVIIIIILSGLIMTLFTPLTDYLEGLFNWIPNDLILDMGLSGDYTKSILTVTYGFILFFVVLIGPVVEELYFRGFLLPRMPKKLRGWTPITHSALFAIYHTWTPWMAVARTAGVLPIIYSVKYKRNLFIGIIAHCILNSIDFFLGVVFIISLT